MLLGSATGAENCVEEGTREEGTRGEGEVACSDTGAEGCVLLCLYETRAVEARTVSDAEAAAVESLLAMRVSRAACMGRAACSESLPVRYPEWEDRGEEEDEDDGEDRVNEVGCHCDVVA